jgi:hypothetical protein
MKKYSQEWIEKTPVFDFEPTQYILGRGWNDKMSEAVEGFLIRKITDGEGVRYYVRANKLTAGTWSYKYFESCGLRCEEKTEPTPDEEIKIEQYSQEWIEQTPEFNISLDQRIDGWGYDIDAVSSTYGYLIKKSSFDKVDLPYCVRSTKLSGGVEYFKNFSLTDPNEKPEATPEPDPTPEPKINMGEMILALGQICKTVNRFNDKMGTKKEAKKETEKETPKETVNKFNNPEDLHSSHIKPSPSQIKRARELELGFYHIFNDNQRTCLVQVYKCTDLGDRLVVGFNISDGGGLVPVDQLTEATNLVKVNIVEVQDDNTK